MQESRLFKILYLLLESGRTTAPALARELEVSVRTIYRDIDALSSAGIPVYSTQGKGGGIFLMDGYVLSKGLFSESDQLTIVSALQSLSALLPDAESELLLKLNALFRKNNPDWIQIDFSRWGNQSLDSEKFNIIKAAILNRQLLSFSYVSSYGQNTRRMVKPLRICYKSHAWYLQAYCMEKEDFRTFKINRMTQPVMQPETFEASLLPPPIDTDENSTHYPSIKLRFKKETAYRVYDEFNSSNIEILENGDMIVTTQMPRDGWIYGYLLSFQGDAEILEPEDMNVEFGEIIKKLYKDYILDTSCHVIPDMIDS